MPRLPAVYPISFLFIVLELPFVFVTVSTLTSLPNTVPAPHPATEWPLIKASIFPIVLSKPLKFTLWVFASIQVTALEFFSAFALFDEIYKITFVSASTSLYKQSKALSYSIVPLSNIAISKLITPHSTSLFHIIFPLSFINLSIGPGILAHSIHLIAQVVTFIYTPVWVFLIPVSLSHIHLPLPLVYLTTLILHNTFALPLSLLELTIVHCLFVLF